MSDEKTMGQIIQIDEARISPGGASRERARLHSGCSSGGGLPSKRGLSETDEMMTLHTLREKISDADLLREMIGFTAQRPMVH